jgi:hypothetical protein
MKLPSFLISLALSCVAIALPDASYAEKRAFVVGINKYASLPSLSTAVEDATAMTKTLEDLGFRVESSNEADRATFDKKWSEFLGSLKPGDVAAFYFAGHGLQADGANYLLPKDTPGIDAGETAIFNKAVNFHQLMEELEARRLAATLYILDACRNNPFNQSKKPTKSTLGQTKGLARMEGVYGAFVMYSAGSDEEALDSLPNAPKQAHSVYARRLLPLIGSINSSLLDVANRVQVQVEEDARLASHRQRPAYFDGIIGQYYLSQLDNSGKPLAPSERVAGNNVVRLAGFATWDNGCQSRPAPRVNVVTPPKYGRIVTRYETFPVTGLHFGNACEKSTQRGVGVYYVIDDAESTAIENVQLAVKHWSVTPATAANETFEIDLATRYSKRTAKR